MSWSQSTSGPVGDVIAAVSEWPAKVEANDKQYGASEELTALHRAQAEKVAQAATAFAVDAKDGYNVSVSGSGHAGLTTTGDVSSDQWSASLSCFKPAPIAAPE